jgi:serine/threonine-protein kinase
MISGQTIAGKYRINQLLGSGGMASVWSATNIFTERQFAIKFMLPAVARTPEAARRFLMEAKVSARVDHPNIIEIIDVGQTEDGSLFLVMELLTGVSLETAIRRQSPPMTVAEFLSVMVQVARALAAAHKSGVIHRDLKPTNIFLHKDREGAAVPKLLDFGVSKFLEEEGAGTSGLTMAGTVLGSPLYMSPEQAMGAPVDARTDVFAFGAIMFEALCGYRSYDAPNFNALIVTIATTQPKKIDQCAPKLPEALRSVVRDCMETERDKRLASFDTIADRLMAAIPEIERAELRLPAPARQTGEPLSDPDATNALPVVKGSAVPSSDRHPGAPTPLGVPAPGTAGPRSGNGPASGFSAPWGTPPGSKVESPGALAVGPASGGGVAQLAKQPRFAYAAGAAAIVVALVVVIVSVVRGGRSDAHTSQGHDSVMELPATPAPPPEPTPSTSVPVISVDSLPVSPTATPAPPERGTGRLIIGSSPAGCIVSIDGMRRGTTPLPPIDLSAGLHTIRCDLPGNKSKSETVTVKSGATARIHID